MEVTSWLTRVIAELSVGARDEWLTQATSEPQNGYAQDNVKSPWLEKLVTFDDMESYKEMATLPPCDFIMHRTLDIET